MCTGEAQLRSHSLPVNMNSTLYITFNATLNSTLNETFSACYTVTNETSEKYDSLLDCEDEERPFVPQLWLQIFWSCLFSTMVLGAVLGNSLVIYIILSKKDMRTKTNIFFLNLSIADLMMATINAMFNFIYMITSNWLFGSVYCKINNFAANVSVASSVFTITATSVDRYIIVVHPLRQRMSKRMSAIVVTTIWILAIVVALPALINSKTFTFEFANNEERTVCTLEWPDGYSGQSRMDNIYNIFLFAVTYIIPMTSMAISYTIMAKILWGTQAIGEMNQAQRFAIRAKQKVVPMLITVTVVFGICWLPYHLYFLYIYYDLLVTAHPMIQHFYLGFYFLAMSNSLLNPIIYCLLNQRFRRHFIDALRCRSSEETPRRMTAKKILSMNSTKQENLELM